MDKNEQNDWLTTHIPHRVRAAVARLPMDNSLLGVKAFIDPPLRTEEDKIYWRCSTDSIWEGRLAASRWLIEFVGIKEADGKPCPAIINKRKFPYDVNIKDVDEGELLDHTTREGQLLAKVWKGCSQASSHATNASKHPAVNERELAEALTIVLDHLENTIYNKVGKKIRDYVLRVL